MPRPVSFTAIQAVLLLRGRIRDIEHRTQCPVEPSTIEAMLAKMYPNLTELDKAYVQEFCRPTTRRLENDPSSSR